MAESSLCLSLLGLFFLGMICRSLYGICTWSVDDNGNVAPPDAPIGKSKTIRKDWKSKLKCTHFFAHDRKKCRLNSFLNRLRVVDGDFGEIHACTKFRNFAHASVYYHHRQN